MTNTPTEFELDRARQDVANGADYISGYLSSAIVTAYETGNPVSSHAVALAMAVQEKIQK